MCMDAIELSGVTFTYRGKKAPALSDVSFRAGEGETVAVIGLTGAGKSTLLKCSGRLVPASQKGTLAGDVRVLGKDVSGLRPAELAGVVGMVFQDFESQLFSTTAELDVAFGPENLGLSRQEIIERVDEALGIMGMEDFRERDPSTLSGGQKQRLAMATVLALRPRILCLDEPVTDLDPEGRDEVAALVKKLCQSGMTVILAEHEHDLLQHAGRVAGLKDGAISADLPAKDALWRPDLLENLGVRPTDVVSVFHHLGISEKPGSVEEAADLLKKKGMAPVEKAGSESAPTPTGKEIIRVEGVGHRYQNGVVALTGVDLSIKEGEFVALLGKNGSGKTTLVKHLNGLLNPTKGDVLVGGKRTVEVGPAELGQKIGFVFQDPDHQIFASTVFEEVAFAPRNFGMKDGEVKERAARSLELVGMSGKEDNDPFLLTKGERQRVALASVLSAEPGIIILDEPTTGLDYPAQRAVMELLKTLNKEGRTVIVITHTMWVAAEYARRVVAMSGGGVTGDGPTADVLSDETMMRETGLRMPEVTELGLALGVKALSPEELIERIKGAG